MLIIHKKCIHGVAGSGDCVQRMMNEFLQVGPPMSMRDMRMVPKSDIYETGESLQIYIELPGVDERDVQIAFDEEHAVLAVYGRRGNPICDGRRRILQKEMVTGQFEKLLQIHGPVDADGITAALKQGILSVILPKA